MYSSGSLQSTSTVPARALSESETGTHLNLMDPELNPTGNGQFSSNSSAPDSNDRNPPRRQHTVPNHPDDHSCTPKPDIYEIGRPGWVLDAPVPSDTV